MSIEENSLGSSPSWLTGKDSACQCRRPGFDPWVRKTPLEEGMATHPSVLAWRIPWMEEPGGATVRGVAKTRIRLSDQHLHFSSICWDTLQWASVIRAFRVSHASLESGSMVHAPPPSKKTQDTWSLGHSSVMTP